MPQTRLVVLAVIATYLLLVSPHIATPFVDDETWEFYASETLLSDGRALTVEGDQNVFHPHGYYYVLAAAFSLFGVNEVSARLIGIIFTIATFLVLLQIARAVRKDERPLSHSLVALIGAFYLLSPLVVQGSLVVTADTSIHHFALTLFAWAALRCYPYEGASLGALSLMFVGCLWIKIVSPVLLVSSIVIFVALMQGVRAATRVAFVVGLGGLSLFFMTWVTYCNAMGESALTAFEYLVGTAESRVAAPSLAAKGIWLARQLSTITWWLGLPTVALLLYSTTRFRKWQAALAPSAGLLLVIGIVSITFFSFLAGTSYGFPRYHVVLAPFASLIIAFTAHRAFQERPTTWALGLGAFAGAALTRWIVGDPILAATFDLKLAFLGWPELASPTLRSIAITLALAALPFAIVVGAGLLARHRVPTVALLTCVALGTATGQHALQRSADHHVSLSYGEHGTQELHAHLQSQLEPEHTIVASKDLVHHSAGYGFMPDWHWEVRPILFQRLKDPRTQFLVLGAHHNTLAQLDRTKQDVELRTLLDAQYQRSQIGSYFVWTRRPEFTLSAQRIELERRRD